MEKRTREQRVVFRVSDKELALINERMELVGIQNREAYLRKMAIDGFFLSLDLTDVKKMVYLLSNATNNLNQIAKRVNETGNIYRADIRDLQDSYEELWKTARGILDKLSKM